MPTTNAQQFEADLAAAQHGDTVKLKGNISKNITINKLVNLDLNGKTITGDVTITSTAHRTISLSNGHVDGDVHVNTPNATINNSLTASGDIFINNVKVNTWNEKANGNKLVINDPDGITLNVAAGNTVAAITVNPNAVGTVKITNNGTITKLAAEADVEVVGAGKIEQTEVAEGVEVTGDNPDVLLGNAKAAAKSELESYVNAENYNANSSAYNEAIEAGKTAIDEAITTGEVETALVEAKKAIDEIKSDAQLTQEAAAREALTYALTAATEYKYTDSSPIQGNYRPLNTLEVDTAESIVKLRSSPESYALEGFSKFKGAGKGFGEKFQISNDQDLIAHFAINKNLAAIAEQTGKAAAWWTKANLKVSDDTIKEAIAEYQMNIAARFLGALGHPKNTVVDSITYGSNNYKWDATKGNKGSNWYDGETSLVSEIVKVDAGNEMILNHENEASITVTMDVFQAETIDNVRASINAYLIFQGIEIE